MDVAAAVVVAVVGVLHRNNHILALSFSRSQVIITSHETKAIVVVSVVDVVFVVVVVVKGKKA